MTAFRVERGDMNLAAIRLLRHRLNAWWRLHRPLAWFDPALGNLDAWRPDPPVMERLIR